MAKLGMLRSTQSTSGTQDSKAISLTVKDIPVGDIQVHENVRKTYSGIDELAESIRQLGLLQPITVYTDGDDFVVKTGHRRFKAVQKLYAEEPERFHSIRCVVSNADNLAIVQLVENVQREDLTQIDLYNALCILREQGLSNREIANAMGKAETYVKYLFVGVKEITADTQLEDEIGYAGITIQDIAETKGITDKGKRLALLEQRGKGKINRAEMRQKVKELKDANISAVSLPIENRDGKPTVKIEVSPNGLVFKLSFCDKSSAQIMEQDIKRLLGRHGIMEKK
jgi:ParB family chromosome partitioning protein